VQGWEAVTSEEAAPGGSSTPSERIARLENEIENLQKEFADLKQQFAAFRKQFE
jgi:archaellum component FlaC